MSDIPRSFDLRAGADEEQQSQLTLSLAAVAADPASEAAAANLAALVRKMRLHVGEDEPVLTDAHRSVRSAGLLLKQGRDEEAEIVLRRHLASNRDDPAAMLLMAEIARKCGFAQNAEKILRRSIEIDPQSIENRVALAKILHTIALAEDRFDLVEELLAVLDDVFLLDPDHWQALSLRASISVQIRRLDQGATAFKRMIALRPGVSFVWMNYAYLLKTIGHFGEAVAAYRVALALDPLNGGAWWGLANLKVFRFFASDIAQMEGALAGELADDQRVEVSFALAKALGDAGRYEDAARYLQDGNRLRLQLHPHKAELVKEGIDRAIRIYSPAFFTTREGSGDPSDEPIFIVGMPRSGSTLVEQILASHSLVEGTEELFAIQQLEGELQQAYGVSTADEAVAIADPQELQRLGERYLHLTHYHRKTDRRHFTDKNPANWRSAGFIHAILPKAKIVDVRRNPLDCCFANYAQHYQWGMNFSYGQSEVAQQYGEYLRLMRHFDQSLPGLVHHLIHDDLVDDFEQQVRRLLNYLGLPFEEACLRFFETRRPVHTPSAEQVRRPINRSGFDKWRNYEPWIGELKQALAGVLPDWRE